MKNIAGLTAMCCSALLVAALVGCTSQPTVGSGSTIKPTVVDSPILSQVSIFSVGTGLCVFIQCPNGAKVLSDCGTRTSLINDTEINQAVQEFAGAVADNDSLSIVISHKDEDHWTLVRRFLNALSPAHPVEAIMLGGSESGYNADLKTWMGTLKNRSGASTTLTYVVDVAHDMRGRPNSLIPCGTTGSQDGLYVLTSNAGSTVNDKSIVLKFMHGSVSATLMGDAEQGSEASIIDAYAADMTFVQTTLLSSAHHGASTGGTNSAGWAQASLPEAVVFSAGSGFANYGHPRCTSINAYAGIVGNRLADVPSHSIQCYNGANSPPASNTESKALFNTANSGALVMFTDGTNWSLRSCAGNNLSTCVPMK